MTSPFDSAQAGINKLIDDGRITCDTIELGGLDEPAEVAVHACTTFPSPASMTQVICGTYQMPDYLKGSRHAVSPISSTCSSTTTPMPATTPTL